MNLDEIAPEPGQRALIIGGTRSGKSTLLDHLMRHAAKRAGIQIALADTKPRFRAEFERIGPLGKITRSAERHYKGWAAGPVVPGSIKVDLKSDLPIRRLWRKNDPNRIAVLQSDEETERIRILEVLDEWYRAQKGDTERLLVIDEVMDFTDQTHGVLTRLITSLSRQLGQGENVVSVHYWVRNALRVSLPKSQLNYRYCTCFTLGTVRT